MVDAVVSGGKETVECVCTCVEVQVRLERGLVSAQQRFDEGHVTGATRTKELIDVIVPIRLLIKFGIRCGRGGPNITLVTINHIEHDHPDRVEIDHA